MLFLGDMSIPNAECGQKLIANMKDIGIFADQTLVINLEGVLHQDDPKDTFWKVYNNKSAVGLNLICKQVVFGLANNHTYDYPEQIRPMLSMLDEKKIPYFGMAKSNGVFVPFEFEEDGIMYAIFGHCWEVYTKTNRNIKTDDRIVDCSYQKFYQEVIIYMNNHPDRKVICFFHWNFDMEEYPFPAYKKLAHDLIDYGVEAVIGNHTHCKHEIEMYHGKVIAYSLGNFYMPDGYFFDGTLSYPEESHKTVGVEISVGGILLHEFETNTSDGAALKLIKTVAMEQQKKLLLLESQYNENAYEVFFRKNRKKRKITPIFNTYDNSLENKFKTSFCIWKIKAIRVLKQYRDKSRG